MNEAATPTLKGDRILARFALVGNDGQFTYDIGLPDLPEVFKVLEETEMTGEQRQLYKEIFLTVAEGIGELKAKLDNLGFAND